MSDIFDKDLDLTLPKVSNAELLAWMDKQIQVGIKGLEKSVAAFEGVVHGDLPRESFSAEKFLAIKRGTALWKAARERLLGVIGQPPGEADEDMDEKFFEIISGLRGYDVTKETSK